MDFGELLFSKQDLGYKEFVYKLTPNLSKDNIIGVRNPITKEIAKQYKNECKEFLDHLPHKYYEENMLHAYFINQIKDYEEFVARIEAFLPYIDNWAVCDCLKPKLKKQDYERYLIKIKEWLSKEDTYSKRFGIEMLMNFYLEEAFDEKYLALVSEIRSEEYYVKMMIAWYFATALVKQTASTLPYLENKCLDAWTHKKTIRKAVESYRISDDMKQYLKSL